MLKKALHIVLVLPILAAFLLALVPAGFASADDASVTVIATYLEDDRVILDLSSMSEISTLDPQVATDAVSITPIENLFHGLTDYDPVTTNITPELATSWEVDESGMVWTFNLRDDVMWYRYDPATQSIEELRPVTASDFVYGIKRGCDPRLGSLYGAAIASVIAGCEIVHQTPDAKITDDLIFGDTTLVTAPDDNTLVIELQSPAGYFLTMTPLWVMRAVHPETIQEFGAEWTSPGNIATNGPFFVQEVIRGVRRVFVRNYEHNEDLDYGGNIDQINYMLIEDLSTTFTLYRENQVDASNVPNAELQNVLNAPDFAEEVVQIVDLVVFYFGFAHDKNPFDDVRVRRAFSAVIDRSVFVEQVLQGRGVPMIHFTPPGLNGAIPIDKIGVGFDPEYARAQLEEAGFPNCDGLPDINIFTYQEAVNWGELLAAAAEEYLGCASDRFTIEGLEFSVLLEITGAETPAKDRPNMWTLGWSPDYPDPHNVMFGAGLACESQNDFLRECSDVDLLIQQAALESDPAVREELYREIEEGFFGAEGEHPVAPLYMRTTYILVKPWYQGAFETDGLFGGTHWDHRTVDMTAKLAARER